jgi:hypothetical protein
MTNRLRAAMLVASVVLSIAAVVKAWELPMGLGGERLQASLTSQLEKALKRKCRLSTVRMEGSQVVSDRLVISNDPDFSQGTFLTADGVTLSLDMQSLISALDQTGLTPETSKGRLAAKTVTLDHYRAQNAVIDWDLSQLRDGVSTASGTLSLAHGPATIDLHDVLSVSGLKALSQLGLPDLSRVPVTNLKAAGRLSGGALRVQDLTAESPEARVRGKGSLSFDTDALAATLKVRRPPVGERGETNAEIEIAGTGSTPVIRLKSLKQKNFKASISSL